MTTITSGKVRRLEQVLIDAVKRERKHMTDEGGARLLRHGNDLQADVIAAIRKYSVDTCAHGPIYCESPESQFERLEHFNHELKFGFSEKQISNTGRALKRLSPSWPDQTGTILTLAPYGASIWETQQMHQRAIEATYPGSEFSMWDGFKSEYQYMGNEHGKQPTIHLLSSIKHPTKPCIQLETIDLMAHWDKANGLRPREVRAKDSAHMGLLASAWQHKALVQLQDGSTWPYWNLAGIEVNVPGRELWSRIPLSVWYCRPHGHLYIHTCEAGIANRSCSSPVVRERKLLAA